MVLRVLGVVLGMAVAVQAAADTVDLNLHEDALRIAYGRGVGASGAANIDLGYLYVENRFHSDHLFHLGLHVTGKNWAKQGNFDIGLGGRLVHTETRHADGTNLAVGGHVRFSPVYRVGVGGSLYYAPRITSFQDSWGYQEWNLMLDYQVLTQAFIYVGYRSVKTKVEIDDVRLGTYEIDDHAHVGMKLQF